MQGYYDVVVNSGGSPVNGASVFVYDAAGALATIYDSSTPVAAEVLASNGTAYFLSPLLLVPQTNPITTGADGRYIFFAENGVYTVVITASGYNTKTLTVALNDPGEAPGITYTTYTSSPNNLVNAASLQPKVQTTNGDLILLPQGNGALLAQVPTGTSAGGNKRGQYAVDFQLTRASASQVASGNYSALLGGGQNAATGLRAAVMGGLSNNAAGVNAAVVGGSSTTAYGVNSAAVGTNLSGALGDYATIVGGDTNSAEGFVSTIVGGNANLTTADYATVIGGSRGTDRGIKAIYVVPASLHPIEEKYGVSQTAVLVLGTQTTNATSTRLTCDGAAASTNNQLVLSDNSAVYFKGSIIANVTGGGNTKSWTFDGQIKRGANAAATTLTGSTISSPYADAGASTWAATLAVDTTNGGLAVNVAGQAATTIRWVCKIETTEVAY